MEDRFDDLPSLQDLEGSKYDWFITDDNHDYVSDEIINLSIKESSDLKNASKRCVDIFHETCAEIIQKGLYVDYSIPVNLVELIEHSWLNGHEHLIGRFDFAGGIDGIPLRLLEYNADTPTLIIETGFIQGSFSETPWLEEDLKRGIRNNVSDNRGLAALLTTSFGYIEDKLTCEYITSISRNVGVPSDYSNLEDIIFSEEDGGVFIQNENGEYEQYTHMYKMFPWEIIAFEEPELIKILTTLVTNNQLAIYNPAYAAIMQSKSLLHRLSEKYPSDSILLKTHLSNPENLTHYVKKSAYGRLGEDIQIIKNDIIIEKTPSISQPWNTRSIYQEFADMYKDDEGYYYQPSMFTVNKIPSDIGIRCQDKLIIDEDTEFVCTKIV